MRVLSRLSDSEHTADSIEYHSIQAHGTPNSLQFGNRSFLRQFTFILPASDHDLDKVMRSLKVASEAPK